MLISMALRLFIRTRQFGDADTWFRQLENEGVRIPLRLLEMAVEVAVNGGQYDRAQELLGRVRAEVVANSPSDLLWLGGTLLTLGKHAEADGRSKEAETMYQHAEAALRRAVEVAPQNVDFRLALIRLLLSTGREAQAEKAVHAMEDPDLKISSRDLELALANYYLLVQKLDVAEKHFNEAYTAAPKDVTVIRQLADFDVRILKYVAAENLVRQVFDGKVSDKPEDVAWARRQLARIYIARGGYQNAEEAQKLLDANLNSPQRTPDDEILQAHLLLNDPDPEKRDRAVVIMETLADRKLIAPDEPLYAGPKSICDARIGGKPATTCGH